MLVLMPIFAGAYGGWEVTLILAVLLILFRAKLGRGIRRSRGEGFSEFRRRLDQGAYEAGGSLGGIFGKPASEALTPDNQTAELYDSAVLQREERTRRATNRRRFRRWLRLWRFIRRSFLKLLKVKI